VAACGTLSESIRQAELDLLAHATLVLTDGPSLYEARREQHPGVVSLPRRRCPATRRTTCIPAARRRSMRAPCRARRRGRGSVSSAWSTSASTPELLVELADAHPAWSLVMAGPVAGIDDAALPRRPNIHWLSLQPYARLPYLLAGWDLCLMPLQGERLDALHQFHQDAGIHGRRQTRGKYAAARGRQARRLDAVSCFA
jgi:hypothetical protein